MTADMVERLSSLKESITLPSQCKRPNDQKYNTFDRIYYRKMTWNLINSHVDLHGYLSVSMHFKKDVETLVRVISSHPSQNTHTYFLKISLIPSILKNINSISNGNPLILQTKVGIKKISTIVLPKIHGKNDLDNCYRPICKKLENTRNFRGPLNIVASIESAQALVHIDKITNWEYKGKKKHAVLSALLVSNFTVVQA